VSAADQAERWCVLHLRTGDVPAVVAAVAQLLGPASDRDVFHPPGFRVQVDRNPDRTRGEHHLDWPTQIDIEADPDADLATFTTRLADHLRANGHDVTPELPPSRRDG
jgi:hypothetical protein